MMQKLVYFDNSAVNHLHKDDPALLNKLTRGVFRPLVSEVNLIELGSKPDAKDRTRRLKTLARLLGAFAPLPAPYPLLAAHLDAYQAEGIFDDSELRIRAARLWAAVQNPAENWTDEAQATVDQHRRAQKDWYGPAWRSSREKFQVEFRHLPEVEKSKHLGTAALLLKYCWSDPARMSLFVGEMLRDRSERAAEDPIDFLMRVPAWRAFLVGHACALHRRVFRAKRFGNRHNPGSLDLSQFVYLPHCDLFVTSDRGQRRVARMACALLENRPRAISYRKFKEILSIAPA